MHVRACACACARWEGSGVEIRFDLIKLVHYF